MVQTSKKLERQTVSPWFAEPEVDHIVQFYTDESQFAACTLEYIYSGLMRSEVCIVMATPEKLINLQKGLRRAGIDIGTALSNGWYIAYDAEELLAAFMDDREIDARRFNRSVAKLVSHVSSDKRPIRIFSELTAVLRQQNNRFALLQLEQAFDDLLYQYEFSLYCAFPTVSDRDTYGEVYRKILAVHDHTFYS